MCNTNIFTNLGNLFQFCHAIMNGTGYYDIYRTNVLLEIAGPEFLHGMDLQCPLKES